jgi:ubiquinone/menaquinone biosynthesis C-methylase UbiE
VTDVYTHGHHESVLRSHRWRTAENSAAYLLPHLHAGLDLLDVGCGPGTITLDLAERVSPGRVLGIDASPGIVAEAEALLAERPEANVAFAVGDVYRLAVADDSYDVVHAHQVIQHLTDPYAAIAEMRRVLRPGGVLALRDGDFGAFIWSPADPLLDRWRSLYFDVVSRNRADANAGRQLPSWVRAAGFTSIEASSSTWTFADEQTRAWWGGLWADRVEHSAFGEQAIAYGLSDQAELSRIAAAWRSWAAEEAGFFAVLNVEVLAWK